MGEKEKKNVFDVLDKQLQDIGTRVSVILEILVAALVFLHALQGSYICFRPQRNYFWQGAAPLH